MAPVWSWLAEPREVIPVPLLPAIHVPPIAKQPLVISNPPAEVEVPVPLIARLWAKVEVAVVEVALSAAKVGVDVATRVPVESVERRELRARAGRWRGPLKVDEAVENNPLSKPRVVEVEL